MSDRKPKSNSHYSFPSFLEGAAGNENENNQQGEGNHRSSNETPPRREENPFSFTQFLKRAEGNSTGTKPKVKKQSVSDPLYSSEDSCTPRRTKPHVQTPDLATGLPDFVQDHLVVEQSMFVGSSISRSPRSSPVDLDKLPGFALNGGALSESLSRDDYCSRGDGPDITQQQGPGWEFVPSGGTVTPPGAMCNGVDTNPEPIISSLPDFLPDGALLSDRDTSTEEPPETQHVSSGIQWDNDVTPGGSARILGRGPRVGPIGLRSTESDVQRLQQENQELRQQLDDARRLAEEGSRKILRLERELEILRAKDRDEAESLERAVEQVESNFSSTSKRAAEAETVIVKLKREVRSLQSEVALLRQENEDSRHNEMKLREKTRNGARQVQSAASSAEHSLQQLLSGVETLRLVASTLSNMDRISDGT